jgi:hypothetical protein
MTRGDHERILAVKIFTSAILAISLLSVAGAADAANSLSMRPHSFDYYDENGVEHTGINLNLGGVSRRDSSERAEPSAGARHHRSRGHHETVLLVLLDPDRD